MKTCHLACVVSATLLSGIHTEEAVAQAAALPEQEASLVGCYTLDFPVIFPDSMRAELPSTIALLETPRRFGVWRKLIPAASLEGRQRRGSWRLQPDGAIRVVWSDGHQGILILATVTTDGFSGTARTLIDIIGAESIERAVQATRTPCPGHLVEAHHDVGNGDLTG
ncbi:MAG: hypothetical protein KY466_11825 [Gemmatimonadetes bacterium]|nr:hypothetical protein [Gemmatimonadota bacterium]